MRHTKLYIFFFTFFTLFSCGEKNVPKIEKTISFLDTSVNISIYEEIENSGNILSQVSGEIQKIDSIVNNYNPKSEVSIINNLAGIDTVKISGEMKEIITHSLKISELSNEAFDITIEPLTKIWNFNADKPTIPEETEIKKLLEFVDYKNILLNDNKLFLKKKNVGFDLDGLAKGYVVDKVILVLKKNGVKNAVVNAGGNMGVGVLWNKSKPLNVWIRHPRAVGNPFGKFTVNRDCGISTSGDYQKYFIIRGKRYHNILNPKTGYPAEGCLSVTIIAPNATIAYAFSTAVFVMGKDDGMNLIEKTNEVEGVIIYKENEKIQSKSSSGIKFELANQDK
jgi:thiamine biosynthesis lipoprotein